MKADLWNIKVHFSGFPSADIESLDSSMIESSYCMSLKEADQIRTKSERSNTFQKSDFKRLWSAVQENKLEEWQSVGTIPLNYCELCLSGQNGQKPTHFS